MGIPADSINAENVFKIVNSLHNDGQASFHFGTAQTPLSGKQCLVYAVTFPHEITWAVRIPVHASHLPREELTGTVEHEVSVFKRLKRGGFTSSPELVAYSAGFDNAIGFPYIVSTWIHGTPLQWMESIPSAREMRNRIIRQIGSILIQLAECSRDSSIIKEILSLPVHFYLRDDRYRHRCCHISDQDRRPEILRVLKGQLPGIDLRSCLLQRALVRKAVHHNTEQMLQLLSHEDLDPSNIIVDDEYNIKG